MKDVKFKARPCKPASVVVFREIRRADLEPLTEKNAQRAASATAKLRNTAESISQLRKTRAGLRFVKEIDTPQST